MHVFTCKMDKSTSKELAFLTLLLKCAFKLGAAILLVFRAVKAILRVCQEKAHYGCLPCIKNTGNAYKGIYVHSQNTVLTFILGYMKLTAISASVTEFVSYVNYGKYIGC